MVCAFVAVVARQRARVYRIIFGILSQERMWPRINKSKLIELIKSLSGQEARD